MGKKGGGSQPIQKILIRKYSDFLTNLDQFDQFLTKFDQFLLILTNYDQFFFIKGGGRSCPIQKILIRKKTDMVKKGGGGGLIFFTKSQKEEGFLCLSFNEKMNFQNGSVRAKSLPALQRYRRRMQVQKDKRSNYRWRLIFSHS